MKAIKSQKRRPITTLVLTRNWRGECEPFDDILD
jgi:hypothetical protein